MEVNVNGFADENGAPMFFDEASAKRFQEKVEQLRHFAENNIEKSPIKLLVSNIKGNIERGNDFDAAVLVKLGDEISRLKHQVEELIQQNGGMEMKVYRGECEGIVSYRITGACVRGKRVAVLVKRTEDPEDAHPIFIELNIPEDGMINYQIPTDTILERFNKTPMLGTFTYYQNTYTRWPLTSELVTNALCYEIFDMAPIQNTPFSILPPFFGMENDGQEQEQTKN
jgi:hypothetical protein